MDIDALDDLTLKTGGMDLINIGLDLLLGPYLACGFIIEEAHQPAHAGNLPDLFKGYGIAVAAIPSESHFHRCKSS